MTAPLLLALLLGAAPKVDAARALEVLRKHCVECHGGKHPRAGLNVADLKAAVAKGLLHPGKPDASELLLRVEAGQMPPGGRAKPEREDRELLRDWIAAGMPAPPPTFGEEFLLGMIAADLKARPEADRPTARYVSLNHLLATEAGVKRLPRARSELKRVLEAFAAPGKAAELTPLDGERQSVFRLDLAAIGWDAKPLSAGEGKAAKAAPLDVLDVVLLDYPYGVVPFAAKGWPTLAPLLRQTNALRPLPYVRGDWLTAALTDATLGPEVLTLLNRPDAPPTTDIWPETLDLDAAAVDLGWADDRAALGKLLGEVGLTPPVRRAEWERAWPQLMRKLRRGTPVLPLDRAGQGAVESGPDFRLDGRTLTFPGREPKNQFEVKDRFQLEVVPSKAALVELAVFTHDGKYQAYEKAQPMAGGKAFYEDNKEKGKPTGHEVDATAGKEWWVLVGVGRDGGPAKLSPGVPLYATRQRGRVRERFVHLTLYALDDAGTGFREPFDRAARTCVPFESLGK